LGDPPLLAVRGANMMRAVDGVSEANKRKVRVFVEAVLNEGRLELIRSEERRVGKECV